MWRGFRAGVSRHLQRATQAQNTLVSNKTAGRAPPCTAAAERDGRDTRPQQARGVLSCGPEACLVPAWPRACFFALFVPVVCPSVRLPPAASREKGVHPASARKANYRSVRFRSLGNHRLHKSRGTKLQPLPATLLEYSIPRWSVVACTCPRPVRTHPFPQTLQSTKPSSAHSSAHLSFYHSMSSFPPVVRLVLPPPALSCSIDI